MKPREAEWTDMEWQLRNWLYFTWLSGDHICEQHVHNLDVVNWAMGGHPGQCRRHGRPPGPHQPRLRQHLRPLRRSTTSTRTAPTCMSMCRQIAGCENNVSEAVVGTKGRWDGSRQLQLRPRRRDGRASAVKEINPYDQEHIDLVASIRDGRPLNELKTVAESTLTAIMGRMSAYTGKAVTWEQALNSKQNLLPTSSSSAPWPPRRSPSPARPS